MTALSTYSHRQIVDANGSPIVGAYLETYKAGTDEPQATYADPQLRTPNPNPANGSTTGAQVTDGNGRLGVMFLAPSPYKIIAKNAAGVTLWSVDYYFPALTATGEDPNRIYPDVVALELLNLSSAIVVYESADGTALMTPETVDGWVEDAKAFGAKKCLVQYPEYQGFYFFYPNTRQKSGTVGLTFSATSGAITVTTAGSASFFEEADEGCLLTLRFSTGIYRVLIVEYSSASQVTGVVLSSASSVSSATSIKHIVPNLNTTIPADFVSTSPLAGTAWAAGTWEMRKWPWDYETNRFAFWWRDAGQQTYAPTDFNPIERLLSRAEIVGDMEIVIGTGRSGDVALLNDIVTVADGKPTPTNITNATQANPVVVTSANHGRFDGERVYLSDIEGMTELNGRVFKVANAATNTFELQDDVGNDIDGTGYTAYSASGVVQGSSPGTLVAAPIANLLGSPSLTSAAWTTTTITATGAFLATYERLEILEVDGPGRLILRAFTDSATMTAVIVNPFSSNNLAAGSWVIKRIEAGTFRRSAPYDTNTNASVLTRAYETIIQAQLVASDIHAQYGTHAAFGGFYISHEPDHVLRSCERFLRPFMRDAISGVTALSLGDDWTVAPASPVDMPNWYQSPRITDITRASRAIITAPTHTLKKGDRFRPRFLSGSFNVMNNQLYWVGDVFGGRFEVCTSDPYGVSVTYLDTSAYSSAYASNGGIIATAEEDLADAIVDTRISRWAFQDSFGYGIDQQTGVYQYLHPGRSIRVAQIDEEYSTLRYIFDRCNEHVDAPSLTYFLLFAIVEIWQIDGELGGLLTPPRPAEFQRVVEQVRLVHEYVDGLEIVAGGTYAEVEGVGSVNRSYLRSNQTNSPGYGDRAKRLGQQMVNPGFNRR